MQRMDVSRNCFNMTYLQLSLMDLQAVVQHGNTLSMEMWETRKTTQMMLFEDWLEKAQIKARANDKTAQMVEKMREFLAQLNSQKRYFQSLLLKRTSHSRHRQTWYLTLNS